MINFRFVWKCVWLWMHGYACLYTYQYLIYVVEQKLELKPLNDFCAGYASLESEIFILYVSASTNCASQSFAIFMLLASPPSILHFQYGFIFYMDRHASLKGKGFSSWVRDMTPHLHFFLLIYIEMGWYRRHSFKHFLDSDHRQFLWNKV